MELPRRPRDDVFLPDGTLRQTITELASDRAAHDLRIGIVYAFDFRTRMLPYWYADKHMAPCAVRTLADVLHAAGFKHLRVVLQQWTPNFRPSMATLDGRPLDILLVSAMQVHAEPSYELVRDAHRLGSARPLILAGGPKAIYEPTDYFELGPEPGIGADCVVTGEAFVLLDLLRTVLAQRNGDESVRSAFERARRTASLNAVPGLVYCPTRDNGAPTTAVHTGVQRLVRDLDELPMPDAGYRLLEPPHRGRRLRPAPLSAKRVRRRSPIASLISTQGCKFNCSYCPIPAANQRSWRHKSPERFAAEIRHIHETFGIRSFFGTDDNFFNNRETVVALMTAIANTPSGNKSLGDKIRFYTEATEFDVHKNIDILPLCRKGGLRAIWFGLEDLTAKLVNKGQSVGKTEQLFARMHEIGVMPMVMLMHNDDQPLRAPRGDLSGLLNQARYLFQKGAVSYQCTYLGPAIGTRSFETAVEGGTLYSSVGGKPIPQAFFDGNHVVASADPKPWQRQLNVLRAYATFYNPLNLAKTLIGLRKGSVSPKRVVFQIIGQIGLLMTIPKLGMWAWQLRRGAITTYNALAPARIPLRDTSGQPMKWTIDYPEPTNEPGPVDATNGVTLPVMEAVPVAP